MQIGTVAATAASMPSILQLEDLSDRQIGTVAAIAASTPCGLQVKDLSDFL